MAAKYPACGRAGLANNRSPGGPPPFHHTGFRQPMVRSCRGQGRCRGGSGTPPSTTGSRRRTPRSRRRHSPALGLRSDRASWPAPPWGRHTRRRQPGAPRAAPQPVALRPCSPTGPKSRCPREAGLGSVTPEFWKPRSHRSPSSAAPRSNRGGGGWQSNHRKVQFALPQLRQIGNH